MEANNGKYISTKQIFIFESEYDWMKGRISELEVTLNNTAEIWNSRYETALKRNGELKKALELWKRLFVIKKHPQQYLDDGSCFFCGAYEGNQHISGCIWIEAKKLVE
jgi:hypothetical protein